MKIKDRLYDLVPILILSFLFRMYAAPYLVSDERELVKKFLYNDNYSNVKPLITDYERYNTIKVLKEKHGLDVEIENTLECCEHIFYHINARRNGLKIKISKFTIF